MLTPELMKQMDTGHLLAAVRIEFDPLTATALELELFNRLDDLVGDIDGAVFEALAESELSADDIMKLNGALIINTDNTARLLDVINDAGINNTDILKAALVLAKSFAAIADDADDVLTRLSTLITTAQEQS